MTEEEMQAEHRRGLEASQEGDFETALSILLPLAKKGHADSQYAMGMFYYLGKGVKKDDKEAEKWLLLAAEQGHTLAQRNLGVLYVESTEIPRDYIRAYMWFGIIEKSGDMTAEEPKSLASQLMTPEDIAKAEEMIDEWFETHPLPSPKP